MTGWVQRTLGEISKVPVRGRLGSRRNAVSSDLLQNIPASILVLGHYVHQILKRCEPGNRPASVGITRPHGRFDRADLCLQFHDCVLEHGFKLRELRRQYIVP